jgi:hydrogenase expression/formation protein HypC
MCLAIPVRITAVLDDDWVEVEVGGVHTRASVALIEPVRAGDYLIVHAGFAIARLDVEEAERTLALFDAIAAVLPRAPGTAQDPGGAADALPARLS